MHVKLSFSEMKMAAAVGITRHIAALQDGRNDKHGAKKEDGWSNHIEGACGELAVAKLYNVHWPGSVNAFKSPDLGALIQIRTRSRHDYDLIVRDDDLDGDVYILVTGVAPDFAVRGWILGSDAKQQKWRAAHGGREVAFFVPQGALHPMEALPEIA
jgi:hypothetical protein